MIGARALAQNSDSLASSNAASGTSSPAPTMTDDSDMSRWADGSCAPHLIVEMHSDDVAKVKGHKSNVGGCGGQVV